MLKFKQFPDVQALIFGKFTVASEPLRSYVPARRFLELFAAKE